MPAEEISNDIDTLLTETGRILILFQRIEHALKGLISLGSISVSNKNRTRDESYQKQSLGQVAAIFTQRHLSSEEGKIPEVISQADEIILLSCFQIEGEAASDLSERIGRAIPDRNRLAHSLITDFDLSTHTGRAEARRWVDESYTDHSRLLEILLSHHRLLREAFQSMISFLQSTEGMAELFLPDIQKLPIVRQLQQKAQQSGDVTWISVAEAAKDESRASVQELLTRFGKKSLSELMIASRLFELQAEETASGGTRMLYRVLPTSMG